MAFLALVLVDAAFSLAGSPNDPYQLREFGSYVSMLAVLVSVLLLVPASRGHLHPRWAFLGPALLELGLAGFAIVLVGILPSGSLWNSEWFVVVHQGSYSTLLVLGALGLVAHFRATRADETDTSPGAVLARLSVTYPLLVTCSHFLADAIGHAPGFIRLKLWLLAVAPVAGVGMAAFVCPGVSLCVIAAVVAPDRKRRWLAVIGLFLNLVLAPAWEPPRF